MNINFDIARVPKKSIVINLVEYLQSNESDLNLASAEVFFNFPIYKDQDDKALFASLLICSEMHGFLIFGVFEGTVLRHDDDKLSDLDQDLENVYSAIYSKLVRNRFLRKTRTEILIPISSSIFAPNIDSHGTIKTKTEICISLKEIKNFLSKNILLEAIEQKVIGEALGTIDGSKGIIRSKPRNTDDLPVTARGVLASQIEAELNQFDKDQKFGVSVVLDGLERYRGLAGSGKTVVLAMKAAMTHLRDPEAIIIYTFFTKSLYQHIKRLITRFYRQFDDKDPDWDRLKLLHGWGGYSGEGVYFNICRANGITPLTLSAAREGGQNPFDYACKEVLKKSELKKIFDYVFIDEGQDFPNSFARICMDSTNGPKVVLAYDEFQTIFQPSAPDINEIFQMKGGEPSPYRLSQDIILKKCYRNPREIIVVAHAIGLGVYGNFVQILENAEQWTGLGYNVISGDFTKGSATKIERPAENSLLSISKGQKPEEIVRAFVYKDIADEVGSTVKLIKRDLELGLRPDDILVAIVDDMNAKSYMSWLSQYLTKEKILFNNIHGDSHGIKDFYVEGHVTLSTVHKAKGNEAYSVYVLGIDALNQTYPGPRERNILFAAITRAKGWVCISGIGESAKQVKYEVEEAVRHFPFLEFKYPDPKQIRIIKSDLIEQARRKSEAERKLAEVMEEFDIETIKRFIKQRSLKKGKDS